MRRKLAAGNWKMNGLTAQLTEVEALSAPDTIDVLLCPPATLIHRMAQTATGIAVGGQDCHAAETGAHTGDTSAEMIADAGGTYLIVGHSERRADHGETEAQYKAGETLAVNAAQLAGSLPQGATADNTVIAYEPVWAIGAGLVPTVEEIEKVHGFIRAQLTEILGAETAGGIRLLYGGSVKPGNAAEIFATPDVDGALVGGASLKAADFNGIITALAAA